MEIQTAVLTFGLLHRVAVIILLTRVVAAGELAGGKGIVDALEDVALAAAQSA